MIAFLALLATATLFGGMALYSFGFAPLVFSALPGEEAGRMLRLAFPRYYLFVAGTAGVAALALGLGGKGGAAAVMVLVSALAVYARQGLVPRINAARDAQLAGDAAARRRFGALHGLSVALNFLQLGAAGWVLWGFA